MAKATPKVEVVYEWDRGVHTPSANASPPKRPADPFEDFGNTIVLVMLATMAVSFFISVVVLILKALLTGVE